MCDYIKLIAAVDRDVEGWVRWKASQLRIPFSAFVEEGLKLLQKKYEGEDAMEVSCQTGLNIRPPLGHLFPIDPEVKES